MAGGTPQSPPLGAGAGAEAVVVALADMVAVGGTMVGAMGTGGAVIGT